MKAQDPLQTFTSATVAAAGALVRAAGTLFRPLGLTVAQFDALELLTHAPKGLRPSELATALIVDPSSTTYLLDQLEKRDWITRKDEPADRRAYRVALTPAGRKLHAKAEAVYRAALAQLSKRIDPAQREAATQLLLTIPALAAEAAQAVGPETKS